jgi:hypothetical protein
LGKPNGDKERDMSNISPYEACIDCHFFALKTGKVVELIPEYQRKTFVEHQIPWLISQEYCCYMGKWHDIDLEKIKKQIFEVRRNGKCFYHKLDEDQTFEGAEKQQNQSSVKFSNRVALWSFAIAVFSLLIAVASFIISITK